MYRTAARVVASKTAANSSSCAWWASHHSGSRGNLCARSATNRRCPSLALTTGRYPRAVVAPAIAKVCETPTFKTSARESMGGGMRTNPKLTSFSSQ